MQRSTERIITTHAGSLPRPPDLLEMLTSGAAGKPGVPDGRRLREAVKEVVNKQIELGIDVIDDGEFGKPSFSSYVNERLGAGYLPPDGAAAERHRLPRVCACRRRAARSLHGGDLTRERGRLDAQWV